MIRESSLYPLVWPHRIGCQEYSFFGDVRVCWGDKMNPSLLSHCCLLCILLRLAVTCRLHLAHCDHYSCSWGSVKDETETNDRFFGLAVTDLVSALRLHRPSSPMPRIRVVWTSRPSLASKQHHVTRRSMMIDDTYQYSSAVPSCSMSFENELTETC